MIREKKTSRVLSKRERLEYWIKEISHCPTMYLGTMPLKGEDIYRRAGQLAQTTDIICKGFDEYCVSINEF